MGGLREYYGELREFPDTSSNFGLLYGHVYGPLLKTPLTSFLLHPAYTGEVTLGSLLGIPTQL